MGIGSALSVGTIVADRQVAFAQQALGAHDMEDDDLLAVVSIKDPARRLDDLPIAGPLQLARPAAALGMIFELLDMVEDAFDELSRRDRILESDIFRDRFQIAERRMRPDYFSHLPRRALAWA